MLAAASVWWPSAASDGVVYIRAPFLCTYKVKYCNDATATNYLHGVSGLTSVTLYPNMDKDMQDGTAYSDTTSFLEVDSTLCQFGGCNDTEATNYNSKVRVAWK